MGISTTPADDGCRICGAGTERIGTVHGDFSDRDYELRRCSSCRYAFIANPWTDFEQIYDEAYYAGRGADPLVDYRFELDHPEQTVRLHEWRGVTLVVERLLGGLQGVRWLDFGCGNGGLVRYVQANTPATACGYDEGAITAKAAEIGVPILTAEELLADHGEFDVVTAIEVLEHTLEPLTELRRIRRMLRPGGLLFLTTGNAAPFASDLLSWSYIIPEIHISFFEPRTLEYALHESGFRPASIGLRGGFDEIIKFKVLKNLRLHKRSRFTNMVPALPLAAVADRRVKLSQHPIGWAA